jgi:enamine deaminase RidA (YjgF/YER057c/UK114 family)
MPVNETIQVELAAANPNLSPATRFGNLVFVAGQTGRHPATGQLGRDVREQTQFVLERIKAILDAAGTSLDNVLTVTTHLTRREDLAATTRSTTGNSRTTSRRGRPSEPC